MQTLPKTLAILSLGVLAFSSAAPASTGAERGASYTPIFGYDDKNGALYGAAAFFYQEGRPGYDTGVYGVSNGRDFHSITFAMDHRSPAGLDLSLHSSLARTFDDYFGEGDATRDHAALRLQQDRSDTQAALLLHTDEHWALGPSLGLKARRENRATWLNAPAAPAPRAFQDSADPALGLRVVYDDRDSTLSSSQGSLVALDLRALPSKLALMDGANDAWQAQGDLRQFQRLSGSVVMAHRLTGGLSLGEPGYAERYSLGGTGLLRGFQDNRFRGRQFYCLQEELRVPVWKAVSAAASVDLGDVSDTRLGPPRRSLQAGIRAGLPPSYGMKARLDVGYGDSGERSLALQFGETF